MKRAIFILIIIFLLLFILKALSYAQTLKGDNYILQLGDDSDKQTIEAGGAPSKPLSEERSKTIKGDGFTAILSYDAEDKFEPAVITASSNTINFGEIKPGEPIIRTISIEIVPGSARGYQVFSSEDKNLESDSVQIPSTSCDSGNCNQVLSDTWALPLVYGFGFRCDNLDGQACSPIMAKEHYKRFSNEADNEPAAKIISSAASSPSSAFLSFKINIPGNQAGGGYQNIIKYIITPNL